MKKCLFIILFLCAFSGYILVQYQKIKTLTEERDMYRQNTYALMGTVKEYRTKDSLNVLSVEALELKLSEVNKYRSDNMKLIESLQVDKNRLQQIITTQTETIYGLSGRVRDSIVYRDGNAADTLRCIDIADKWFDLSGCIDSRDNFTGMFETRDSLLYVEHIVPPTVLVHQMGSEGTQTGDCFTEPVYPYPGSGVRGDKKVTGQNQIF